MRYVLHMLSTEGFAIVAADTAEQIDRDTGPYVVASELSTWGDFRRADLPLAVLIEVVETELGDLEEYLEAIEASTPGEHADGALEDRWRRVSGLEFAGTDEYPSDAEEFGWTWSSGDPDLEVDLYYRSEMLVDLPDSVLDEFDVVDDTTLDDGLGRVSDDLDAVVDALRALGHTVD